MNTRHNFRLALIVAFCALISLGLVSRTQSQGASPEDSHRVMWLSRQTIDSAPPPQQISKIENKDGVQMPNLNPDERMSFQTFRNGNWDIYTMPGVSETIGPIQSMYSADITPDIRPGGYRSAYASAGSTFNNQYIPSYQILTSFSDGFGAERLTAGADNFSPAWSPDALKIAFVSNRTGAQQVYVMSSTGTNQTCLSCDSTLPSWSPTWSPAGDQIAFARPVENTNTGKIHLVSANGGQTQLLRADAWKYLGNVRWSPNGEWIAFDAAISDGIWNNLWEANVRTGEVRRVYDPGEDLVDAWMGDWSPDGTKLLFTRVEYQVSGNQLQIKNTFIEEVSWIGGQSTRIATGSNTDRNPSVQKRTDLTPPTAQIKNLPEYTHGTQAPMPIAVDVLDEGASGTSADLAELQARKADSANWVAFENTSNQLMSWIGSKVFFRIRARDHEGNWSAWTTNPDGDIGTTFYSWAVNINPVDYRDHSVSQSAFDFIPKPVDFSTNLYRTSASIKAVVGRSGTQTVTISAPGFNTFTKAVSITADTTFQAYLSPRSNKVINGDFENSLENGWQIAGTRPPERVMSDNYEGQASVNLPPGAFIPEILPDYFQPDYYSPFASINDDGSTTLIWTEGLSTFYASKPAGGRWPSSPVQISLANKNGNIMKVFIDRSGGVHFLYAAYIDGSVALAYCYKPSGLSICQENRIMGITSYLDNDSFLADLDSTDTLQVLIRFANSGNVRYQYRTKGGVWSSMEQIVDSAVWLKALVIDIQKNVHVFYYDESTFPGKLLERIRSVAGQWSTPELMPQSSYQSSVAFVMSLDLTQHLFISSGLASSHYTRRGNTEWVKQGDPPGPVISAVVDINGNLHILATNINNRPDSDYYTQSQTNGEWKKLPLRRPWNSVFFGKIYSSGQFITVISPGYPEYSNEPSIFLNFNYVDFLKALSPSVQQVIAIPSDLHKAILAFQNKQTNHLGYDIKTQVIVESPSKIISASVSSPQWQLFTKDVSEFSGQTITLSVSLDHPVVYSFDQVLIDQVSIGGWETPTALDVTPTRVPNPEQATTLTITGENFFGAPIVRARNIPANSVTVVNENTIQATWNGTLPVGILNIEVENPGGALAVLNWKVISGNPIFVYLPVASR
ncbi:MAG: hypothetical protein WAU96_02565 [Anaerolineae bacterium]